MRSFALASGSSGNCFYLETDSGFSCLIDLGLSFKKTSEILKNRNIDIQSIDCVFITHEHIDHCYGLNTFLKNTNSKIYTSQGTFKALSLDKKYVNKIKFIKEHNIINIKNGKILALKKSHDAKEPLSFIFEFDSKRIGFFTDLGFINTEITEILKKCNTIYLEANYCSEFIKNNCQNLNWTYINRLTSNIGHLGLCDTCNTLKEITSNSQKIVLSHISENTNSYENTYKKIKEALLQVSKFPEIFVSFQAEPTEWIE